MKTNFFAPVPPAPSPRVLWLREILEHKSDEQETFVLLACLYAACAILWIGLAVIG